MVIILNILGIEILKMKRTLGFWLTLVAPLAMASLECLVMWSQGESMIDFADGNIWLWHTKYILTLWGLLVLPLFVTLETALLASWEHKNQVWKVVYTLPIPRWMVVSAKQFSALVLMGISQVVLWAGTLVTGILLSQVRPDLGFKAPVPWLAMLGYNTIIYLVSWLIIAVHSTLSLQWNNFVVAMAAGILATMSGVFFVRSDYAPYYPWAMAGLVANNLIENGWPVVQLALGILGGMTLFMVSNLYLTKQDVL